MEMMGLASWAEEAIDLGPVLYVLYFLRFLSLTGGKGSHTGMFPVLRL